jgi:hypothetical protein
MDSILKQLFAMEHTLKEWMGTENGATFRAAVEDEAENIPPGFARTPQGVAAGTLHSIEIAARMLRKQFGLTTTMIGAIKVSAAEIQPPQHNGEGGNSPEA